MPLTELHYLKRTSELEKLCEYSKSLYNRVNFFLRRDFFSKKPLSKITPIINKVKNEIYFKDFHNTKTAKQTIRQCYTDWSNFFKSLNAYKLDPSKYKKRPKPPGYKEKLAKVIFYNETIQKGKLKLGIFEPTNKAYPNFIFSIKSKKKPKKVNQVCIIPKQKGFSIQISYEEEEEEKETNNIQIPTNTFMSIDLGVNNLCAITSNQFDPLLINGRILKSYNQWFNKVRSTTRSIKRHFRIENYFHCVSKLIINLAKLYKISTIIIGKNNGWKQNTNIGAKNNQNFQSIPFNKLIQKIEYKAARAKISTILTEESYTSKASFLDLDPLPKYEPNNQNIYKFSGKRINRGTYKSKTGTIHADVNGSLNIARKVKGDDFFKKISYRSLAARPRRIDALKSLIMLKILSSVKSTPSNI